MAFLTVVEMQSLFERYCSTVDFINSINFNQPNNQKIKQIQIPNNLTQSMVYHMILQKPLLIGLKNIESKFLVPGSTRTYDIIYNGNPRVNIEVKATGTNEFQRFRPHALTAHFVFWINLNSNNLFDLAVFDPKIITPKIAGEVEITWRNLIVKPAISVFQNMNFM